MRRIILLTIVGLAACDAGDGPGLLAGDLSMSDARVDLPITDQQVPDASREVGCDATSCDGDYLVLCIKGMPTRASAPCAFGCDPMTLCNVCRPASVECHGQDIDVCNDDGLGWTTFRTCAPPCTTCQEGDCASIATCDDKECGDDGCGVACGYCTDGERCVDGTCVEK